MIGSTLRTLLSVASWRRLWDRLADLETVLATTDADILAQRLARLEGEMAEVRAHAGLPQHAPSRSQPAAS